MTPSTPSGRRPESPTCTCGHVLASHRQDPVDPWAAERCKTCGCGAFLNRGDRHSDWDDDDAEAMGRRELHVTAPSLCYVRGSLAIFTTAPLGEQWGDDWDDAPYEHNAGEPYDWRDYMAPRPRYELTRLYWDGADLIEPDWAATNSPYSVQQINAGQIAWLRSPSWAHRNDAIHAGATIPEFRTFIASLGGTVYEAEAGREAVEAYRLDRLPEVAASFDETLRILAYLWDASGLVDGFTVRDLFAEDDVIRGDVPAAILRGRSALRLIEGEKPHADPE